MPPLHRLHWSTFGEPTEGLEHQWAGAWEVTVDRSPLVALPPEDTDLWVVSAVAAEPPPALLKVVAEVSALPLLLLRPPETSVALAVLEAWSALGSVRWGSFSPDPPKPGLRPLASRVAPLTAGQALNLGLIGISGAMLEVPDKARCAAHTRPT